MPCLLGDNGWAKFCEWPGAEPSRRLSAGLRDRAGQDTQVLSQR